ncbi:MAG TPA: hypothetical protein VK468_03450, partial [Pyrinomonadaceae bacterium]|nr:hypothetical protein [Pyrinomonadaceae bacterium]
FSGVEDERDLVLSVGVVLAEGGSLIGRLEIVFTILWRSCADPIETKPKLIKNAQTDRYEIFFKLFKTYTPKNSLRGEVFIVLRLKK